MSTNNDDDIREMLEFAQRWLPYGGGPDDEILVTFGVPAHRFYDRLARVLDDADSTTAIIIAPEATALRALCRARSRSRRTFTVGQ